MEQREEVNTTDICSTLFWHLSEQGLIPTQVNQLVKDVFNILKEGGVFTVGYINQELEVLGWQAQAVDDYILELILSILEKEFKYTISSHTVH
ncbi:MAG: hypothetical protein KKD44_09860 [Proteobacteria bacterium]|nr:hypothetical protein [Pseudomonadota bacterium]